MGSSVNQRYTHVGFDYMHSLVDAHCWLAIADLDHEMVAPSAGFLARATTSMIAAGTPRIRP
jgi:hypothetical protein